MPHNSVLIVYSVQQFLKKSPYEIMPPPDRVHHIVEDFLTLWEGRKSHILPLRRFIETVTDSDLRHFFAEDCLKMALVYNEVPNSCQEFNKGFGLTGTNEVILEAYKSGLLI